MTKTNLTSVDVDTLYLGGVAVTATAAELNKSFDYEYELLATTPVAPSIKNGVIRIAKTSAGVVTATLAPPVAGTDDFKRLNIINFQTQTNLLIVTEGFGGAGSGEDTCTFTNVLGSSIELMAYNGHWYITGQNNVGVA